MAEKQSRLDWVKAEIIRPLNQAEVKSVAAGLRDIAKIEPLLAELLKADSALKEFIIAAFTLSPYLRDTAAVSPALLVTAVTEPLEPALDRLVDSARNAWRPRDGKTPSENEVMTALRTAKRGLSFLVALADLARVFSASDTTRWLSAMADACVAAAIDHLLLAGQESGKLKTPDPDSPSKDSGLIVHCMGKHGGR